MYKRQVGALAVSADFRRAVYTMIQKVLPIEMQLTYQVDGEPCLLYTSGLQLGMGGGSILDLGDCPHTVFVLNQTAAPLR